jgi:hypothetical protein
VSNSAKKWTERRERTRSSVTTVEERVTWHVIVCRQRRRKPVKSAGPEGSCGSEAIGPYPKRQGGGDYIEKRGPINVTRLFVLNNDIEDLLRFQATVHLRRETTTANALADMGGSDNFIARSFLRRLREAGVTIEMRTEGLMEVCTAGKQAIIVGDNEA